jgi:hypothetical protein
MPKPTLMLALTSLALVTFSSCDFQTPAQEANKPKHPMVGAWLATDGSIFDFRDDGTFHGIDSGKNEIWGNWVVLSPTRIGFQSLRRDSSYQPQYAIIGTGTPDEMDYIVAGGTDFIHAKRIPTDKANTAIDLVVEPQLHSPPKTEPQTSASP